MEIFHITHIKNLPSILKAKKLLANSQLQPNQYTDIAHNNIQDRRAKIQVPCAAKGTLHDYVPFYFAPRSPMLYAIHRGNVTDYRDGQEPILHLVVDIKPIVEHDFSFTFTDGHAVMAYSEFYEDLSLLNEVIDWDLMKSRYWFDTEDYPDRKRCRQAEFLIYEHCPWDFVTKIVVINNQIANDVKDILQQNGHSTPIHIYPDWYY
ncbi:MAG: DUF4433 domain-containing protein [Symploca sp. SIO1B1]|nr:DUF4433 domain-containing protein [Symploca sp. SIO1B1]